MVINYYDVNRSLKGEDAKLRKRLRGITMYADIRGRTPGDRLEFITVPLTEENRKTLRTNTVLLRSLKNISHVFHIPIILFVYHHPFAVFGVYKNGWGKIKFAFTEDFFRSLRTANTFMRMMVSCPVWEGSRLPDETEDSAVAYSYFHNLLPADCWCVDIDCYTGDFWEVKRKGERLTYNQRVLKRIVESKGYKFRIKEV